jgi:hypothetical protein
VVKTTHRKFRIYWAWQDDKEEAWLREMAGQGWHLSSLALPGFYTFTRGDPQDVVYRLDFVTSKTDLDEYKQLFADAGWEHCGTLSGWQYFRKPAGAGGADEIYTDTESKIEKYYRLLGYAFIFLPIMIIVVTRIEYWRVSALHQVVFVLSAILLILYAYIFIRILMRIRQLRRL